MYPPSISYSMYKIEHGVALSDAERSAADRRDALVPAAMTRRSRALLRFVTRARLHDGLGRPVAPRPLSPRRRRRPTDGTSLAVLRTWSGVIPRPFAVPSSRRSRCIEVGR